MEYILFLLATFIFFTTVVLSLTSIITADDDGSLAQKRWEMVETQIISRGIQDSKLIEAMIKVPRHVFVPEGLREAAYSDVPLPIGEGQTISQPYIVALMTELLQVQDGDKVLEIGTGSGYQTAILTEIGCFVYTVEIIESLSLRAQETLRGLGYDGINFKVGDGYRGWAEYAPYDAIIATAAPDHIPKPLIEQLKREGRMIIPVGDLYQELILFRKTAQGMKERTVTPVRFVPMTGEAQKSIKGN